MNQHHPHLLTVLARDRQNLLRTEAHVYRLATRRQQLRRPSTARTR